MSDVSKLNFGDNGGDRNVKDAVAREKLTVVDPTEGSGLIQFGVDANGNYGYKKVGADTVTPFKSGEAGFKYKIIGVYSICYGSTNEFTRLQFTDEFFSINIAVNNANDKINLNILEYSSPTNYTQKYLGNYSVAEAKAIVNSYLQNKGLFVIDEFVLVGTGKRFKAKIKILANKEVASMISGGVYSTVTNFVENYYILRMFSLPIEFSQTSDYLIGSSTQSIYFAF